MLELTREGELFLSKVIIQDPIRFSTFFIFAITLSPVLTSGFCLKQSLNDLQFELYILMSHQEHIYQL